MPFGPDEIEANWVEALKLEEPLLAIDEVQKIRGWSEIIKRLWDQSPRKLKLVLLGSAELLIERNLKESLAGRYELIRVEHWNFLEAQQAFGFSLLAFVEFGCYPGSDIRRRHFKSESIIVLRSKFDRMAPDRKAKAKAMATHGRHKKQKELTTCQMGRHRCGVFMGTIRRGWEGDLEIVEYRA